MPAFNNKIKIETPGLNVFPLSYNSHLTAVMGNIIPVLHKEIIPSDTFKISLTSLMRLAPMMSPVYDRLYQDFHAFFVPNRILDDKWKEFITGGVGLTSDVDVEIDPLRFRLMNLLYDDAENPHIGANVSSLADYLNLHFAKYDTNGRPVSANGDPYPATAFQQVFLTALPFLGYAKIWDDWYRNERIQPAVFGDWSSQYGNTDLRLVNSSSVANWQLLRRNYRKDIFTTALPEPVVGGPVVLPLDGSAEVQYRNSKGVDYELNANVQDPHSVSLTTQMGPESGGSLWASLKNAATTTIQQLKTAFKMYSFFMKDTYNGNRYVEFIESHFNVRVPDATLDRAIYLGSFRNPVQFGEVYQTAPGSSQDSSVGDYAGRGAAGGTGWLVDEHFLEHGQLYILMSIVPESTYFQGIDRKFFKKDRFDYFFPEFQNIGDVEIRTGEIFANYQTDQQLSDIFGYNSRWYELKSYNNECHGDFLTNMNTWDFKRYFDSEPKISKEFSEVSPINSPFVNLDEYSDNYLIDIHFNIKASRPIMMYETF